MPGLACGGRSSCSFSEDMNGVDGHVAVAFHGSTRPMYIYEIYLVDRAKTEVDSQITLRNVTGSAPHFVNSLATARTHCDLRSDTVAIGAGSHGSESNPVIA